MKEYLEDLAKISQTGSTSPVNEVQEMRK
jgi:hypothetical protein